MRPGGPKRQLQTTNLLNRPNCRDNYSVLPRIQPVAPKRIQAPFDHTEFVFELKMDGWRCLAYIENGACRLISRKQNQLKSFGQLAGALAKLKVQNAIIDGEVVCLDPKGRSVFQDVRRRKAHAILYCFDLLWLNNEDLRKLPLVERKLRLRHLIRASRNRSLLYASHMERHGVRLFQAICEQDCEGIVGKYKRGAYAAKPVSWVKILNPSYSQMRGREEMFERFRERREHVESR
jgi:bifunctional non-homologous end joining protein LigD